MHTVGNNGTIVGISAGPPLIIVAPGPPFWHYSGLPGKQIFYDWIAPAFRIVGRLMKGDMVTLAGRRCKN